MHLYVDGNRYWFDLQPTVTRLAEDRARDMEAADVWARLIERLGEERRQRGPFAVIHVVPKDSADVPDEPEARLVILGPDCPHTTPGDSKARVAAEEILTRRGQQPRVYRNTLLFLAPDGRRLEELEKAMRASLAWHSISRDREVLQLTPFQVQQAESKASEWEKTVASRILETWIWAMAPHQPEPTKPDLDWSITRMSGLQPLAERAGKRFESDDVLLTRYGPKRLRAVLDGFELWRGQDHVSIRQLAEDFATYLYLPRLGSRRLIEDAIVTAVSSLVCDHVAYAEGHEAGRYEGLVATGAGHIRPDPAGLVVKPEVALAQLDKERPVDPGTTPPTEHDDGGGVAPDPQPGPHPPRRFFASVSVDPVRTGRDAGRIAEEVIQHLATLPHANVRVTLEIEADVPDGVSDQIQRVVQENCTVLKFREWGFH